MESQSSLLDKQGCLLIRGLVPPSSDLAGLVLDRCLFPPEGFVGRCGGVLALAAKAKESESEAGQGVAAATKAPSDAKADGGSGSGRKRGKRRDADSAKTERHADPPAVETVPGVLITNGASRSSGTGSGPQQPQLLHVENSVSVPLDAAKSGPGAQTACGLHGRWTLKIAQKEAQAHSASMASLFDRVDDCFAKGLGEAGTKAETLAARHATAGSTCSTRSSSASADSGSGRQFEPDSISVFCENLDGRVVSPKKPLGQHGWAYDPDLSIVDRSQMWRKIESKKSKQKKGTQTNGRKFFEYVGDGSPVLHLNFSPATVTTLAFKRDKKDRDEVVERVELGPGDAILRWGEARSWCTACVGAVPRTTDGPPSFFDSRRFLPFDCVQVLFHDHRRLREARPEAHRKIHGPLDSLESWYQYELAYAGASEDGSGTEGADPRSYTVRNTLRLKFLDPASCALSPSSPNLSRVDRDFDPAAREKVSGSGKDVARDAGSSNDSVVDDLGTTIERLERHLADTSLAKTHEVDKRVLKTPKQRKPLRSAAATARAAKEALTLQTADEEGGLTDAGAGVKEDTDTSPSTAAAAATASASGMTAAEKGYFASLKAVLTELSKAQELDSDACLRDGLHWCKTMRATVAERRQKNANRNPDDQDEASTSKPT